MQNKMNMKNKIHKSVPRNSQINLSAQEFEQGKNARNDRKHWIYRKRGCKKVLSICYQNDFNMQIGNAAEESAAFVVGR